MLKTSKLSPVALLLILTVCLLAVAPPTRADEPEFDALANYIKQNYQAQKVKIPFFFLARLAVKLVRPAGVKSFKFVMFEQVKLANGDAAQPLNQVMREVLAPEWQPLIRVRARDGQQMYVYAREAGKDVKLLIASIDHEQAFVVRVKFSPQALAKWMQNPEIMGVSLK